MNLLAVDASQPKGAVAIMTPDDAYQVVLTDGNATELLSVMLQKHDYSILCIGNGPGRMSGLRTTASYISAASWVCDTKVSMVSSLLIMATSAHLLHGHESWQVIIDARLGQFYVAEYRFTKSGIDVVMPPSLVDELKISEHSCGMELKNSQSVPEVVFDAIPWLPALSIYDLWCSSDLITEVDYNKIDINYLRKSCI